MALKLVPSYLQIDGMVFPLLAHPQGVRLDSKDREFLQGPRFVVSSILNDQVPHEVLKALEERRDLPMRQELSVAPADPISFPSDYEKHIELWQRLTGNSLDPHDAYSIGASFLDDKFNLVLPRSTFIVLMTKLYELNDAVREGRMEPRIDDSMPVPPLPLPPPERNAWTDEELRELEEAATELDELDPLWDSPAPDPYSTHSVENRRAFLFAMLEVAYLRTEQGDDDVPPRLRELELPTLIVYDEALTALRAYLRDPARAAIVDPEVEGAKRHEALSTSTSASGTGTGFEIAAASGLPVTPFNADVSLDLFRLPEPLRPAGLSSHTWIAHCEAAFVRLRITGAIAPGTSSAQEVFTRVLGHQVKLRYRPETTPVPRLWRIELLR